MNNKNLFYSGIIWLSSLLSAYKGWEFFSQKQKLYNNLEVINTHIDNNHQKSKHTIWQLQENFSVLSPTQKIQSALQEYKNHSLPYPDYDLWPEEYNQLAQIRYAHSISPKLPDLTEEYNENIVAKYGAALCSTLWITSLKKANARWPEMRKFFGQEGKDTRQLGNMLLPLGRRSLIDTRDKTAYYGTQWENYASVWYQHYNNLLSHLQETPAHAIMTARYADSHFKNTAQVEGGVNGTHTLHSQWTIKQTFDLTTLGINSNIPYINKLSDIDKKTFFIYALMYQRAIKDNMIGEESIQLERIRSLITQYPDLLQVQWGSWPINTKTHISFTGIMVYHVYPIGKVPTPYLHFVLELIAANGGNTNKDGGKFTITDVFVPTDASLKYNTYKQHSTIYTDIWHKRDELLSPDIVQSTYIFYHDESIWKSIESLIDTCIQRTRFNKNNSNCYWLSPIQIKLYLKKYWKSLGILNNFSTNIMFPIPALDKKSVRSMIDRYDTALQDDEIQLQQASQGRYDDYLKDSIFPKCNNEWELQKLAIVYPVPYGSTEIDITKKILYYLTQIAEHNTNVRSIMATNKDLTNEELIKIYHTIRWGIIWWGDENKNLVAWSLIKFDISTILQNLQTRAEIQQQLWQDYLPSISDHLLWPWTTTLNDLEINKSNHSIIKHTLIRETTGQFDYTDIGQFSNYIKSLWETLWRDNINSEGPLQIRLDNYIVWENSKPHRIVAACESILHNKTIELSNHNRKKLEQLYNICSEIHDCRMNHQDCKELEKEASDLLSDIVDFTPSSLSHPENNMWSLLSIKLIDYQISSIKYKYYNYLITLTGSESLTDQELWFIQHFCVIANHLWASESFHAYKLMMATHILRWWWIYWIIRETEREKLTHIFNQFAPHYNRIQSFLIRADLSKKTEMNWKERCSTLDDYIQSNTMNSQEKTFIIPLIKRIKSGTSNDKAPRYNELKTYEDRTQLYSQLHIPDPIVWKEKKELFTIKPNILTVQEWDRYSEYINDIPSTSTERSAIIWFLLASVAWLLKKRNK